MLMQMSTALSPRFLQMNRKQGKKSNGSGCHQIPLRALFFYSFFFTTIYFLLSNVP